MAKEKRNDRNILGTSGFKSPMDVGPIAGDAYNAPVAPSPGGPVPDPIGNISSIGGPKAPKMLPEK
jgi:hypothetical protein